MKRFISNALPLLLAAAMLTGCAKTGHNSEDDNSVVNENGNSQSTAEPIKVDFSQTDTDMFTKRDAVVDYDKENSILIQLNGGSVTASSDSVRITGDTSLTIDAGKDGMFGGKGGMSSGGGSLAISGGNIFIKMGGDGLVSNGSMSVTGGNMDGSFGGNKGDKQNGRGGRVFGTENAAAGDTV